jgi:hypothetical protein
MVTSSKLGWRVVARVASLCAAWMVVVTTPRSEGVCALDRGLPVDVDRPTGPQGKRPRRTGKGAVFIDWFLQV